MALEHNAYLGRDDLGKLLRSFSLPCILSLLVSALYNIVDQIFIGNSELGYLGNAATGVVFPLLMVAMAFGWCVGDGCAAYLSLCQGKGDAQSAHRCVGSGVTMTFAASVFLMIVCGIWQEPLLRLFGASDTTIGMAMEYFTILLGAFPFYMLTNSTNGSIRADGSPKYAMLSTVSGAVTNIVLDPIFIFGLNWGIKGAAWATVAGQVLSFVLNAAYLLRKAKSFRLEKASFKPHWRVFFASVQLGISTFVTQISIVVVSLVCNLMLSHYGTLSVYGPDIPISVISIETKVYTIVINIVVGVVLGGQPILGYNYGAGQPGRILEAQKFILLLCLGYTTLLFLIGQGAPGLFVAIFSSDGEVARLAAQAIRIYTLGVIPLAVQYTVIDGFTGMGMMQYALPLSFFRKAIYFIPLFLLPMQFGAISAFVAEPISDFVAPVASAFVYWQRIRYVVGLKPKKAK